MFVSASHQDRQPTPDAKSYIDYIDLNDPCRNRASSCTSSVKTMFTVSVCAYYSFLILYMAEFTGDQALLTPLSFWLFCCFFSFRIVLRYFEGISVIFRKNTPGIPLPLPPLLTRRKRNNRKTLSIIEGFLLAFTFSITPSSLKGMRK